MPKTLDDVETYFTRNAAECDSCPLFSRWTEAHGETLVMCGVLDGQALIHGRFVSVKRTPDDCPGVS